MTLEEHLFIIVDPIIPIYPDSAPMEATTPYCTYQRLGGRPVVFVDNTTPDKKNAVVQINCWADTALEASNYIARIETALLANRTIATNVITEAQSAHTDDPEATIKGRMQDFSIWYPTN